MSYDPSHRKLPRQERWPQATPPTGWPSYRDDDAYPDAEHADARYAADRSGVYQVTAGYRRQAGYQGTSAEPGDRGYQSAVATDTFPPGVNGYGFGPAGGYAGGINGYAGAVDDFAEATDGYGGARNGYTGTVGGYPSAADGYADGGDSFAGGADRYGRAGSGYGAAADEYASDAGGYDWTDKDYGRTANGHDSATYDSTGYDSTGYDSTGYDSTGYDSAAYDSTAYGRAGTTDTFAGAANGYAGVNGYAEVDGYAEVRDGFTEPDFAGSAAYLGPGSYTEPGLADPMLADPMLAAPDTGVDPYRWQADRDLRREARCRGLAVGAVTGFLAAAVAIGVSTLIAGFIRPQASPMAALGSVFVDRTPAALKNVVLQHFGTHGQTVLLLGMYAAIAVLAVGIGLLARRGAAPGVASLAAFSLLTAFVTMTRPGGRVSDVVPAIIGGMAGIAALLWLMQASAPLERVAPARQTRGTGRRRAR